MAWALVGREHSEVPPHAVLDAAVAGLQERRAPATIGLAHGPSGVALALCALAETRRDHSLARRARLWLELESAWFDPDRNNWADLRYVRGSSLPSSYPVMTAWCHGAPGMGLVRARMCSLGEDVSGELAVAVATTSEWVAAVLDGADSDLALCHGLAGNAWILGSLRGDRDDDLVTAAAAFIAREATCGPATRTVWSRPIRPGLMTGWAGIGLFLLWAAGAERVPNPLDPR